jgi:hypothetical protein
MVRKALPLQIEVHQNDLLRTTAHGVPSPPHCRHDPLRPRALLPPRHRASPGATAARQRESMDDRRDGHDAKGGRCILH